MAEFRITKIQVKRGLAADWTSQNTILSTGEFGYEKDTGKLKIGDGTTPWNSLDYISDGAGGAGLNQEQVEDIVNGLIIEGNGISKNYNDAGNSLTLSLTGETFTLAEKNKLSNIEDGSQVNPTNSEIVASIDAELGNTDWKSKLTQEEVQDFMATALTGGTQTNISVTYDDANNAFDFFVSGGGGGAGLTEEEIEDLVAGFIVNGSGIQKVYDDVTGVLTLSLSNEIFTTSEKNKLSGIESGATADMSPAEIKAAYESLADTNAFTDAEKTKLGTVDTNANENFDLAANYSTTGDWDFAGDVDFTGTTTRFLGGSLLLPNNTAFVNQISTSVTLPMQFNNGLTIKNLVFNSDGTATYDGQNIIGALTTDQSNRLINENKTIEVLVNSNRAITTEDIEISSGANIGKKVFLTPDLNGEYRVLTLNDIGDTGDLIYISGNVLQSTGTLEVREGTATIENLTLAYDAVTVADDQFAVLRKLGTNSYRIDGSYTEITADTSAPTVSSATVENADPDALVVVFNEAVDIVDTTGLSLDGDFAGITITGVTGSGTTTLTFALDTPITGGNSGNFVYGGTNTITDGSGNPLASNTTVVTNNVVSDPVLSLNPLFAYDNTSIVSSGTTNGDAVTQWSDISGNGNHAIAQVNALYRNGSQGPEVEFNNAAYFTLANALVGEFTLGVDEFTVVVRESDNISNQGYYISKTIADTSQGLFGIHKSSIANFRFLHGGTSTAYNTALTTTYNKVIIVVVTTTQIEMFIDGVSQGTAAIDTVYGDNSAQPINIGGRSNGGYLMDTGGLDYVALIPSAVNTSQRQAIEAQLQVNP